jgi:hypothetical protein
MFYNTPLWRSRETRGGLTQNGTDQLVVHADDVNLLRDNIDAIKRNTEITFGRK